MGKTVPGMFTDRAIFNAQIPPEGPKCVPIVLPFSQGDSWDMNLLLMQSQQFMSLVQAIFIDNAKNSASITFTTNTVGQILTVGPNAQAYLPIMVAKNSIITATSEGGVDVQVILLNVPVPAAVWDVSNDGGREYAFVAASQSDAPLGTNGGAKGDLLEGVLIIPATVSPGAVYLNDGATSLQIFVGGTASVTTLIPFFVPINALSVNAAWQVTTGANVSVIATGNFT